MILLHNAHQILVYMQYKINQKLHMMLSFSIVMANRIS
mgnify:CR=1 FL=1